MSKKKKKKKNIFQNVISKIENKSENKVTTYKAYIPCHVGFTEIYKNMFIGKESDLKSEFVNTIDVLIPLNDLDGRIWDSGFRGEIMYVPIKDYSVLPKDVEQKYVKRALELLQDGNKIAIFCLGGHGRTGYFASLILSELGITNPIKHIRENYCSNAVEDKTQLIAISEYMGNEELIKEYEEEFSKPKYGTSFSWYYDDYPRYAYNPYGQYEKYDKEENDYYNPSTYKYTYSSQTIKEKENEENLFHELLRKERCKNCVEYFDNICLLDGNTITEYDDACEDFCSAI